MHGIISYMFDCWADPFNHLLLLKSSIGHHLSNFNIWGVNMFQWIIHGLFLTQRHSNTEKNR